MTTLSPDTVRRIEDAAAALIAAGTLNPTNEQVRQHLGGGSLSHISPVMRAFRARQREQGAEQTAPLPTELAQLLTGQLGLLWQAAVKQAEAGALESELAVLREVVAERDRHRRTPGDAAAGHESGAEGVPGGRPSASGRTAGPGSRGREGEEMNADTRARVEAFRRALELAAYERSVEPVPFVWRDFLRAFPRGCCELASQTLAEYLTEDGSNLHPYVIGMDWRVNAKDYGHVIVALDGEYIDLTLDQFDGYDDRIVAEPIEYGGQIAAFIQNVRAHGGTLSTRELTFDGIPDQAWKLYAWLKEVADDLFAASGQGT